MIQVDRHCPRVVVRPRSHRFDETLYLRLLVLQVKPRFAQHRQPALLVAHVVNVAEVGIRAPAVLVRQRHPAVEQRVGLALRHRAEVQLGE